METERKVKKDITMSKDNYEYVVKYQSEKKLRSFSAALDEIVRDHKEGSGENIQNIAVAVIEKYEKKYSNLLNRLRVGVNSSDFNSQVLIELFNTLILNLDITTGYPTAEVKADPLRMSEAEVKKRIAYLKQVKDDKKIYNPVKGR